MRSSWSSSFVSYFATRLYPHTKEETHIHNTAIRKRISCFLYVYTTEYLYPGFVYSFLLFVSYFLRHRYWVLFASWIGVHTVGRIWVSNACWLRKIIELIQTGPP